MTKKAIIEKTIRNIRELPLEKAKEVMDFAELIRKQYEESILSKGIEKIASEEALFDFLNHEPDLYSIEDLKVTFNG